MVNLNIQVVAGIAYLSFAAGVVTASAVQRIKLQMLASISKTGEEPDVFVADLRRPLWVLGASDLDSFFDSHGNDEPVRVPAALVVHEAAEEMFKEHAWSVAQKFGVTRRVFTDYERAVEWSKLRQAVDRRTQTAP